jgi:hypothetical protein
MEGADMKNTKSYLVMIGKVMTAVFFLVAVMGVFSDSYAKGKHGSMKYNASIVPKFGTSVKIPENLDVYFYGPADRPYAVIGIIKGTPFDPVMWEPISSDAENIGKWRYLVESYNDMLRNPYWGYDMLDPDGKLFGHWLSYERRTVIKMSKDNKLQVYTPDERSRASEYSGGTN